MEKGQTFEIRVTEEHYRRAVEAHLNREAINFMTSMTCPVAQAMRDVFPTDRYIPQVSGTAATLWGLSDEFQVEFALDDALGQIVRAWDNYQGDFPGETVGTATVLYTREDPK
jgi:hypothetical protein